MSTLLDHLKRARAALIAFDPALAESSLTRFEAGLLAGEMTPDQVEPCSAELSAIRDLAQAAKTGVANAQQQLREILDLSRRLDTYDKAGKRKAESVSPLSARKY